MGDSPAALVDYSSAIRSQIELEVARLKEYMEETEYNVVTHYDDDGEPVYDQVWRRATGWN